MISYSSICVICVICGFLFGYQMVNLYAPGLAQPLGQQRAMAGRRGALHAHQGHHGGVRRQVDQ